MSEGSRNGTWTHKGGLLELFPSRYREWEWREGSSSLHLPREDFSEILCPERTSVRFLEIMLCIPWSLGHFYTGSATGLVDPQTKGLVSVVSGPNGSRRLIWERPVFLQVAGLVPSVGTELWGKEVQTKLGIFCLGSFKKKLNPREP